MTSGDRAGVAARSSGDLLADRRFGYAEALITAGDYTAAADLLRQVLERTPRWVPALMALGTAAERNGDREAAMAAYAAAAVYDAEGIFGADAHASRLAGQDSAPDLPTSYVTALFDDYAPRFDRHLREGLAYRGPAVIRDALRAARTAERYGTALDLGCGTGLMGRAIRDAVDRLEGVDLSPAMVRQADATGVYDRLRVGAIADDLAGRAPGSLDVVLAADVFVYVGALDTVLGLIARALAPDGMLAFTAQRGEDAPMRLGDDMRISHSASYLRRMIADAGLDLLRLDDVSTRTEAGRPVPGLVAVARKP